MCAKEKVLLKIAVTFLYVCYLLFSPLYILIATILSQGNSFWFISLPLFGSVYSADWFLISKHSFSEVTHPEILHNLFRHAPNLALKRHLRPRRKTWVQILALHQEALGDLHILSFPLPLFYSFFLLLFLRPLHLSSLSPFLFSSPPSFSPPSSGWVTLLAITFTHL